MKGKEDKEIGWYYLLPLMFIISILPLIVYLKVMPLTGPSFDFWVGASENYDFFSYYKGMWLLVAASLAIGIVTIRIFQNDQRLIKRDLKPFYAASAVYAAFVLISTLASDYLGVATTGFPDRYEGAYVLIAYIVVFLATTALVSYEGQVRLLVYSLLMGALAISIIGVLQYLGLDPLRSDFGKHLILPEQYINIANELEFSFTKHTIYATLFHYNYVGSYGALVFPLCLSLFILTKDNPFFKSLMGIMSVLVGILVVGSNARSGLVGVTLALCIFLIAINKILKKYWKVFAASLILLLAIALGLNQLSEGYLGKRVSSLFYDVKVVLGIEKVAEPGAEEIPLKGITLEKSRCIVETVTETLSFHYENETLGFFDGNNIPVEYTYDKGSGKITLHNPAFQDYALAVGSFANKLILQLEKGKISLMFALESDRIALVDNKGSEVSLEPVESWGFEGNEKLGSSRGYIWSRSLPLLKNTLFFGYGPDTFAIAFPQHDFYGKLYAYDDMWHLVDKPHNLYLQIAINTGIISLCAFLFLVGLYIYKSFRLYVSNPFDTFLSQAGVGIFAGIVGYLGAGFFNDSVVSVAPVFWCLLGLGVSINHMLQIRKTL
ncbi:Lipid A core - O-antigen ligase and related enzymes [Desulfitobacterium sp. LBE]|uniref:O-antigen ligase family protein n=1 Tax=Desulfitobacterium sp. LBE TaxID=884086 RepID=UPI001199D225|nr:O-antigen ligase family protein [Desulfitobacterium sp. LBE]TWH59711.1 Lipid A core - O-antigen ligase and related enzymes [Desulfitobacterium sp. LBE]